MAKKFSFEKVKRHPTEWEEMFASHISEVMWIHNNELLHVIESIFKNRDITLPTRVRLVKAMVFPVVMYGCESWTVKKAEHQRIDAFEL